MVAKPGSRRGRRGVDPDRARARRVSAHERLLWERVMRDAEPLARPPAEPSPEDSGSRDGKAATEAEARPRPAAAARPAVSRRSEPAAVGAAPASPEARFAGLDKRSAQRLRRGLLAIEARLDLHGHTQPEAERALGLFLERAQAEGKRCVLVITGKGAAERGEGLFPDGRAGVLHEQVPRWLGEPRNRARVVAWHPARPKHGGGGALYVLLRRQRG